jgi:hypothetical protein
MCGATIMATNDKKYYKKPLKEPETPEVEDKAHKEPETPELKSFSYEDLEGCFHKSYEKLKPHPVRLTPRFVKEVLVELGELIGFKIEFSTTNRSSKN